MDKISDVSRNIIYEITYPERDQLYICNQINYKKISDPFNFGQKLSRK